MGAKDCAIEKRRRVAGPLERAIGKSIRAGGSKQINVNAGLLGAILCLTKRQN
jgi:hypothetical protein